ncbi:MAG: GAF domain-containing protein [Candidatus Firestonebacteria bacterium]|nr:GAF domain-containing protein [Candidatus Firestonebacteria bacterium]
MPAGSDQTHESILPIHNSLTRAKILLNMLQITLQRFQAEESSVLTLLPHNHDLEVLCLRARNAKRIKRFHLPRNHGIEWWLYNNAKALVGPGALMRLPATPALNDHPPHFQPAQIRSFMALPFKIGSRNKGTLVVINPAGGQPFDARDLASLRLVAQHGALALENAATHESLQALNQELGRQVKATTAQLLNANEFLRSADRAKSDLISMVSHELRTPITAITGFAKLLSKSGLHLLSEEQLQFFQIIQKHSESLERLITDLLDITKIEQGHLEMRPNRTSLNALVNEAVISQRAFLPGQGECVRVVPAEESSMISGDRIRLLQVINNLMSNAFKYSPVGTEVTLRVKVENRHLNLEVENEGDPLTTEQLERVFEKFFRIKTTATQNIPGSGLGLAVSKMIIQAHGGRIWAENRPDRKVAFCFALPQPEPEEA